jgi:hypothetical protein
MRFLPGNPMFVSNVCEKAVHGFAQDFGVAFLKDAPLAVFLG